jgi:hypothetical protein
MLWLVKDGPLGSDNNGRIDLVSLRYDRCIVEVYSLRFESRTRVVLLVDLKSSFEIEQASDGV